MKKIRFISLFLCIAMLAMVLVGCAKSETNEDATVNTADTSDGMFDKNGYLKDDLPDDLDFENELLRVFTWKDQLKADWGIRAQSSNVVEKALYEREIGVCERLNVELEIIDQPGAWADHYTFIQALENDIMAGDNSYHMVSQYTPSAGVGAMKKLYADLNTISYLDLEKPWWPKNLNECTAVGDKVYFASGDITTTAINNICCMYVNMDMYASLGLDSMVNGRSIYEVVQDGDWTIELFKQMIATVSQGADESTRDYGYVMGIDVHCDNFLYSAGYTLIENNGGVMNLSTDLQKPRFIDWFDEIQALICDNSNVTVNNEGLFAKSRSLFTTESVGALMTTLADLPFNFSILPVFKQVKEAEYYSTPTLWVSMYSVPTNSPNMELSGAALEAFASYSYRAVTPEVYYTAFSYRYLPNDDNAKMFDIITDNVVYDAARMFADHINIYHIFRSTANKSKAWASIYTMSHEVWENKITSIVETLNS